MDLTVIFDKSLPKTFRPVTRKLFGWSIQRGPEEPVIFTHGNDYATHPDNAMTFMARAAAHGHSVTVLSDTGKMQYEHHGNRVWVQHDLKGLHRLHCLCYSCSHFKPGDVDHCKIAAKLYAVCVEHSLVTPVYECPEYVETPRSFDPRDLFIL